MKVRELVDGWPLSGWSCEWDSGAGTIALATEPGALRLAGFAGPDSRGWFTITAIDLEAREWSTSFQVVRPQLRTELEQVLADHLRIPLIEIGEVELG